MNFLSGFRLVNRDKFLLLTSGVIGLLTPLLPVTFAVFWGVLPLLIWEASSRRVAFLVAFSFYLSFSRGIVPGAYVFFQDGSLIRALLLWLSSSFGLSLPALLCWSSDANSKVARVCKMTLMLCLPVVPPLGLIGWGTPLVSAGVFFPGCGWSGLCLLVLLYVAASTWRSLRRGVIVLMLVAGAFCCAFCPVEAKSTEVIQGIDLSFGRLASGSGDFDAQFQREREVFAELLRRKRAGEFKSAIVVLPETVTGQLYPTTCRRWRKFFYTLDPETAFVIGGEIPHGAKYDNVMVAFNVSGEPTAMQRCPVPFSMYRPFSSAGANAAIFSRGECAILNINGQKIGTLVCYEQFLTWPLLSIMTLKPDIIIAPANFWWCKGTSLPQIRNMTMTLLAAIFDVPVVSAVNI